MKKLILLLLIITNLNLAVKADDSVWGVVKGTAGVLIGTPVSFFTGALRGAFNKSAEFSDSLTDEFGGSTAAKFAAYPLGIVSGVVAGGLTGAVKGVGNGIYYGTKEPFTPENFTMQGDFEDFDPFDFDDSVYGSI